MTNQFEFSSESAARVLNHISASIMSYHAHGNELITETLKHRNAGRIEALEDIHRFLTEMFKISGLEILELESEDIESETEVSKVDVFAMLGNAFSHFSK
jgi:hypothetical protein